MRSKFGNPQLKQVLALIFLLASVNVSAQERAQQLFNHYKSGLFQIQIIELGSGNKSAIGSGFGINNSGLIATNYHVVSDFVQYPDKYRIQFLSATGAEGDLTLHNFDVVNDLAILRLEQIPSEYLPFELADKLPVQGVPIYSLGNPHDLGMIVVPGTFNGLKKTSFYQRIHFTGSINPGMSGGPVVNAEGQVVGVNVATAGNQIGFLIPLKKLQNLADQPDTQIHAENFKLKIEQQLMDNQQELVSSLLNSDWKKSKLGKALVPDAVAEFISCWGDSNAEDSKAQFLSVENRCRLGEQIYINRHFQTGAVEMEFEWLESETFSPRKFYTFYSDRVIGAGPGNPSNKDDVTNYQCQNSAHKNSHGVSSKTIFCLRAYKHYKRLYDVLFIAATLDHEQAGLISHYTLSGVAENTAKAFTEQFLEAISWQ